MLLVSCYEAACSFAFMVSMDNRKSMREVGEAILLAKDM
jgi:hypothetical protein